MQQDRFEIRIDANERQIARNLTVGAVLYPISLGLSLLYLVYAIGHFFIMPVSFFSLLIAGLALVSSLITFLFGLMLVKLRHSLTLNSERAIRSEERFRRLTEASGEGILIHDGDRITDVNPAFCQMVAASAQEIEGQTLSEFLLSPTNTDSHSRFETPHETVGLRRDGSVFPVEVRARSFPSQTKELKILTLIDLSERKSAGQLIAEQQRMLFEADKLSALGEMAAGIIHEIRNPLTSILLQTEFLKKRGEHLIKDQAFMSKSIDHISSDAARINRIIHGIRLISRNVTDDTQTEDCPIKSLVMDAVELCRERFNRQGIRLSVEPPLDNLVVPGNPTQILQVLINLLTNACDAIESFPDPWVAISSSAGLGYVEISVTDSGTGVSAEVRDKIMQPFFTTKPVGKGTGLGLSISKKIMEAHRGHLRLDEQSNHTRFIIRLPCSRVASGSVAKTPDFQMEAMPQAARRR